MLYSYRGKICVMMPTILFLVATFLATGQGSLRQHVTFVEAPLPPLGSANAGRQAVVDGEILQAIVDGTVGIFIPIQNIISGAVKSGNLGQMLRDVADKWLSSGGQLGGTVKNGTKPNNDLQPGSTIPFSQHQSNPACPPTAVIQSSADGGSGGQFELLSIFKPLLSAIPEVGIPSSIFAPMSSALDGEDGSSAILQAQQSPTLPAAQPIESEALDINSRPIPVIPPAGEASVTSKQPTKVPEDDHDDERETKLRLTQLNPLIVVRYRSPA